MEKISLDNRQIQLTVVLKLQQLRREAIPSLTYQNIEDTLKYWKWRKKMPRTLHEAVNDILSLTADEIVQLLSQRAIVDGYRQSLSDFQDLIGGIKHE